MSQPEVAVGVDVVDAIDVMGRQCTARSPRGAVAAAAPTAARIGVQALDDGGNAYDAVVAAALAETVLLPPKCGLAGDLIAMVWPRGEPTPKVLLAIGGAAAGLAAAAERGELKPTGPTSVGVPGAPAGYLALAERGTLDLARLAQPAIEVAREGYCWSDICATLGRESHGLVAANSPEGSVYFPGGDPLAAGAVISLPGLARALERLVVDRERFLEGPVGRAIVDRVVATGGVLRLTDLADAAPARWTEPVSIERAGNILFAAPAPTHGPSLLDALARAGGRGPVAIHEAVMRAIAKRNRELADPSGTSMVSAVDHEGTLAVLVHSNSFPRFGSGLIVDEYDLVLSNRAGRGFHPDPSHPNFPAPGRRPATTLHAWGVSRPDGEQLLGATPGGANQMPWNAQSIDRLLAGASPAQAVLGPRWEWLPDDDGLRIEAGFGPEVAEALSNQVLRAETVGLWQVRSAMQIVARSQGVGSAVVDPRTQGAALPR